MQIPKAQKNTDELTVFCVLGSSHVKALITHVGEIDPFSPLGSAREECSIRNAEKETTTYLTYFLEVIATPF